MNNADKPTDFENLAELATVDHEGDKKQDTSGQLLLKIKRNVSVRTSVRAGASIVGLARH